MQKTTPMIENERSCLTVCLKWFLIAGHIFTIFADVNIVHRRLDLLAHFATSPSTIVHFTIIASASSIPPASINDEQ